MHMCAVHSSRNWKLTSSIFPHHFPPYILGQGLSPDPELIPLACLISQLAMGTSFLGLLVGHHTHPAFLWVLGLYLLSSIYFQPALLGYGNPMRRQNALQHLIRAVEDWISKSKDPASWLLWVCGRDGGPVLEMGVRGLPEVGGPGPNCAGPGGQEFTRGGGSGSQLCWNWGVRSLPEVEGLDPNWDVLGPEHSVSSAQSQVTTSHGPP